MRLLVYTMLFPHRARPHHGVFVKERLRRYRERYDASVRVVAPTPLVPPIGPAAWDEWRGVAWTEELDGFPIVHPRFLSPPGFGDRWRARLMALGTGSCLVKEARRHDPAVVDVHYGYPDGVAAALLRPRLERALGRRVPMVLTVRGTDLNLLPGLPAVRPQIARALCSMDHVICVADALREVALELGVPADRVTTLRNGVDVERFSIGSCAEARDALGLPAEREILVCVGHLIERKGQALLLQAYANLFADVRVRPLLVFVGDGEARGELEHFVAQRQLAEDVRFAGAVAPEELPPYYRAADLSVLASSREGWPNVVLESLACGTPVLATRVWGTPEILTRTRAGLLVDGTLEGLTAGLARRAELAGPDLRRAAREWAEGHTWDATVEGMQSVFERVSAR